MARRCWNRPAVTQRAIRSALQLYWSTCCGTKVACARASSLPAALTPACATSSQEMSAEVGSKGWGQQRWRSSRTEDAGRMFSEQATITAAAAGTRKPTHKHATTPPLHPVLIRGDPDSDQRAEPVQ